MVDIFSLGDQYSILVPSVLKAAVIKTFGYLIQHEQGKSIFTEPTFVC